MQSSNKLQIIYAVLVLMVAQAHCTQLMCYICENCAQITDNTPKEVCDESYFNKVETTPSSPTTAGATAATETPPATTQPASEDTTTTTEIPASTKPPIPTASTVAPPQSTTSLPTPPTPGTVAGPIDAEAATFNLTTTTTPIPVTTTETAVTSATAETTFLKPLDVVMQPAQLRVRQLRSVESPTVTYHCFTVQETLNGTVNTSRGCSRINQTEAVCPQLESVSGTKYSKCMPCSNSLCNGTGAIGASAVAVVVGLVAALLLGFPA